VLARHELGFVSRLTGLRRRRGGDDDETAPAAPPPVGRLVAPIEELGPTFVRLAQLIAKRADLLPPDRRIELAGTSWPDRSLGADAVEEVLLEQFGAAGHPVTLALGAEPVAATATTETYEATLDDGRDVVAYNATSATIESDMRVTVSEIVCIHRTIYLLTEFGADAPAHPVR